MNYEVVQMDYSLNSTGCYDIDGLDCVFECESHLFKELFIIAYFSSYQHY